MQKYCRDCSNRKDVERQTRYAVHRPQLSSEAIRRRTVSLDARRRVQGALLNASIEPPVMPNDEAFVRRVAVAIPFDYLLSKNAIWRVGRGGHVYVRQEVRERMMSLVLRIRQALAEPWPQRKTYLDLLVQKPDQRGDALNVLDFVADAVKRAIAVDDRWFSVRRLDWQIVKKDPQVFVTVLQEAGGAQVACSFCGRLLDLDRFWRDKTEKLGVQRECKDCSRVLHSAALERERAGQLVLERG